MLTTLSAITVALFGFFAQLGMQISTLTFLVLIRFLVPFIITLPFFLAMGTFKYLSKSSTFLNQCLRVLFVLVSQYSLFYYYRHASLINATMLWNTSPIFMPLIAWAFYRHKIDRWTWVSVVIGIFGVACIVKPTDGIINPLSFWGLLAGFGTAFSQVLLGINREEERNDVNVLFLFFFCTLASLLIFLIIEGGFHQNLLSAFGELRTGSWYDFLVFFFLGICSIGNQFIRGMAYSKAKPALLAPFIYLSVFFAGVLDWVYYHRVPDYLFLLGAVMILFSSCIKLIHTKGYGKNKKKPTPVTKESTEL